MRLPDAEDEDAIFRFAMSFNGYEHYGSLKASAAAAQAQRRDSLTAIRNELFFAARAARHGGDDRFLQTYRELLPLFEAYRNEG